MKNRLLSIALAFAFYSATSQKISFSSNGHINNLQKIDTLFYTEYSGKKPSTKTAMIDSNFSSQLLQFDNTFGFTSKNLIDEKMKSIKLNNQKKNFITAFYANSDGALQAPTSTLFFKPKNTTSELSRYGAVTKHPIFDGYFNLQLNTTVYSDGDKILLLCDSLYNAGIVEMVEPVFVRRIQLLTDPLLPQQWNINNTGQVPGGIVGADMKVQSVWTQNITGTGIKVAVIDVGVDLNHPDLIPNLLPGFDATGANSAGGPRYDIYNVHGTEVAGIIAEAQNNIGAVGVAYNAKIIPIRIGIADQTQNFLINDALVTSCFEFALNSGADIITNSWGGNSQSAQIDLEIQRAVTIGRGNKGAVVLFAAGNTNSSSIVYPASNSNVIAVGGSTECDTRKRSSTDPLGVSCDGDVSWGSNYGIGLDIIAPGVYQTTATIPYGGDYINYGYTNIFGGTSAASPNAAAVVALILSANPNLTGQQARNILESTCDKVGGYTYNSNVSGQPNGTWSTNAGYGRVNALSAICKTLIPNPLIITGNASFCTNSTYTVNAPAGITITWSASPSNIVNLSSNGNSVTLTALGSGQVTLTASVAGPCGPISSPSKIIAVGSINSLTGTYSTATSTKPLLTFNSGIPVGNVYVQYQWSGATNPVATLAPGSPSGTGFYAFPNGCSFNIASGQAITVNFTGNGTCGQVTATRTFMQSFGYSLVVSPNPTSGNINITITQVVDTSNSSLNAISGSNTSTGITKMYLYNFNTNLLVKQWAFPEIESSNYNLNISGLKSGYYILKLERDNKTTTTKILVQ